MTTSAVTTNSPKFSFPYPHGVSYSKLHLIKLSTVTLTPLLAELFTYKEQGYKKHLVAVLVL